MIKPTDKCEVCGKEYGEEFTKRANIEIRTGNRFKMLLFVLAAAISTVIYFHTFEQLDLTTAILILIPTTAAIVPIMIWNELKGKKQLANV